MSAAFAERRTRLGEQRQSAWLRRRRLDDHPRRAYHARAVSHDLFDFQWPTRALSCRLVGGKGHYDAILGGVQKARRSVWVATANLKDLMVETSGRRSSHRSILEAFADLHTQRGVELRILHAGPPSRAFRASFDRCPSLVRGGLELRQCPRVHLKLVIVDAQWDYIGSANWTGAGLGAKNEDRRNFEIGVTCSDVEVIDHVQAMFDAIWTGAPCPSCRLRDRCEAPLDTT